MEQLAVLKQRIKTVETIKKVTHAMRLISMSSHTRLLGKKKHLTAYKKSFTSLWASVQSEIALCAKDEQLAQPKELLILVGAQKGLCGTFNTGLFKHFEKEVPKIHTNQHVIGIGHFAIEYLKRRKIIQIASYPTLTEQQFVPIALAVTDQILKSPIGYQTVTVYSNEEKSFFIQQPKDVKILPFTRPKPEEQTTTPFLFEQSPELLRETLRHLLLSVSLQELLFESLLAEQAARFISMDASTRNADTLITSMKLGYNKIRQATITRELTELSATL